MKTRIVLFVMIATLLLGAGCEKMPADIRNITLYNQPLSVIKHCIQGKWKVVYGKGGFNAIQLHYWDDYYMEFTKNNRIIISIDGVIDYENSKIRWDKDCNGYTGYKECVYVAEFINKSFPLVIDKIQNDTLIVHELGLNPIYYHLIKTK